MSAQPFNAEEIAERGTPRAYTVEVKHEGLQPDCPIWLNDAQLEYASLADAQTVHGALTLAEGKNAADFRIIGVY